MQKKGLPIGLILLVIFFLRDNMQLAKDTLKGKVKEINMYLDFLINLDKKIQLDKELRSENFKLAPIQHHILIANTFILIYNMVEGVIMQSIHDLENEISKNSECPRQLSTKIKEEWISIVLGITKTIPPEERLKKGVGFYNQIISDEPFKIRLVTFGGGNWNYKNINKLMEKLGIDTKNFPKDIIENVKNQVYNEKGCLDYLVDIRNKLAHGEYSFSECGKSKTTSEIKDIFNFTKEYLETVINAFDVFLKEKKFIQPS